MKAKRVRTHAGGQKKEKTVRHQGTVKNKAGCFGGFKIKPA